ncbi:MAG: ATP-binding cassette domain-containing protein [Rhodospirillales bacterium]|nr:ATP-binding cassette domain-containing protein [Rhodospirillales bacterium]
MSANPPTRGADGQPSGPNPDNVIDIRNATKHFRIYDDSVAGPIRDALSFWPWKSAGGKKNYKEFTAVDDVSLTVERGEIIGIIGPNGAGKTTLLKMIAGLLSVDDGDIHVAGRVTSVFVQGVAAHPEFSGRENIYHNGLLFGMSPEEIRDRTDWIIDFSELGEAIDRPFRTYSSGMQARLLFSISMSIDPEIFIVDEALTTGDARFIEKCQQRLGEICSSGATVLFVTHALTQVMALCDRAYLMEKGQLTASGDPETVVASYNKSIFQKEVNTVDQNGESNLISSGGSGAMELNKVRLLDEEGHEGKGFQSGKPMTIEIEYEHSLGEDAEFNIVMWALRASDLVRVAEFNTLELVSPEGGPSQAGLVTLKKRGIVCVHFNPLLLLNDKFSFWIRFFSNRIMCCNYYNVASFYAGKSTRPGRDELVFMHPGEITVRPPSDRGTS